MYEQTCVEVGGISLSVQRSVKIENSDPFFRHHITFGSLLRYRFHIGNNGVSDSRPLRPIGNRFRMFRVCFFLLRFCLILRFSRRRFCLILRFGRLSFYLDRRFCRL